MSDSADQPNGIAAPTARPWRRWHRSTWLVMVAAALALLLANRPGRIERQQPSYNLGRTIYHGWPWTHLTREYAVARTVEPRMLWGRDGDSVTLHRGALAANLALGMGLVLVLGGLTEWRRRRRRRFWQVSLIEGFVAVAVVAACSAGWGYLLRQTDRQAAALLALETSKLEIGGIPMGPVVSARWESRLPDWWIAFWPPDSPPRPGRVVGIHAGGTRVDTVLKTLPQFSELRELSVALHPLDDPGNLENLLRLKNLLVLDLACAGIRRESLAIIGKLESLVDLDLSHNPLDGADLRELHALKKLKYLDLTNTGVSVEGVDALQAALPDLEISDD